MSQGPKYENDKPDQRRLDEVPEFFRDASQDETPAYYTDYADGTPIADSDTAPADPEPQQDFVQPYSEFIAPRPAPAAGQFFEDAPGYVVPSAPAEEVQPDPVSQDVFAAPAEQPYVAPQYQPEPAHEPVQSVPEQTFASDTASVASHGQEAWTAETPAPESWTDPHQDQVYSEPVVDPADVAVAASDPVMADHRVAEPAYDPTQVTPSEYEVEHTYAPEQAYPADHSQTPEPQYAADPAYAPEPEMTAEAQHYAMEQQVETAQQLDAMGYAEEAPIYETPEVAYPQTQETGFFDPLPQDHRAGAQADQDPASPEAHVAAQASGGGAPGLIRGGFIGVVLFLAVIGSYGVIREVSQRTGVSPVSSAQAHTAEDAEAQYQALVAEWTSAKVNIDTSISNWQRQVADNNKLSADIMAQEKLTASAEEALTASVNAVAKTKQEAQAARERMQELENDRLSAQVLDRKAAVDDAADAVSAAKTAVEVAVAEEAKVKGAVDQLEKAAQATAASAQAAEVVVNAAKAAKEAVAASNSVLSNTQNSDLQSLENDFYNQAVTQFETAKAQADATRQAADVAKKRLGLISDEVAKRRQALANAEAAEKEAIVAFAEAEKAFKDNEAKKGDAANENAEVSAALAAAEQRMEDSKSELQAQTLTLENLKARLQAGLKLAEKLEGDVNRADAIFASAEEKMRGAQRERSEHNAARLAALNADLHDKLRAALGSAKISHPVYDRFVLSSEALFQPGSARLAANGQDTIGKITGIIEQVTSQIPAGADWILRIDGHTDATPLSGNGNFSNNWELSQARALSVVKFLVDNSSLPPTRLSANGFGEHQPLTDGTDPAKQASNRRIEIVLTSR